MGSIAEIEKLILLDRPWEAIEIANNIEEFDKHFLMAQILKLLAFEHIDEVLDESKELCISLESKYENISDDLVKIAVATIIMRHYHRSSFQNTEKANAINNTIESVVFKIKETFDFNDNSMLNKEMARWIAGYDSIKSYGNWDALDWEEIRKYANFSDNEIIRRRTFNNSGLEKRFSGDLNEAIKHYKSALEIMEAYGDGPHLIFEFTQLAECYLNMGNLIESKNYLGRASKFIDQAKILPAYSYYYQLGMLYFYEGKHKSAIIEYTKAFDVTMKSIFHTIVKYSSLFWIILSHSKMDEIGKTVEVYANLKSLEITHTDTRIPIYLKFAEAIKLKSTKRFEQLGQAIIILKEIVNSPLIITFGAYYVALMELVDILLDELNQYQNDETLIEILGFVEKMTKMGYDQKSHLWTIKALMLKARIQFVYDLDIVHAQSLYDQAENLAREHSIEPLIEEIKNERNWIEGNLEKWSQVTFRNSKLVDRIKETELQDYIKHVTNLPNIADNLE